MGKQVRLSDHAAEYRAGLTAQAAPRIGLFAELLANGLPVKHAAAQVGVSEQRAHVWLKEIKAQLGWQAI